MKKLILIMVVMAIASSYTFAQRVISQNEVPEVIIVEFQKRHPNIKNARWENSRNEYVATFDQDGTHHVIEFDEKGNAHKTKIKLKEHEVPVNVNDYASRHYPEVKYKEVEKITDRNGKVSYSMRIKDKEHYFDENGHFVKDTEKVRTKDTEKNKN